MSSGRASRRNVKSLFASQPHRRGNRKPARLAGEAAGIEGEWMKMK